jgi:pyruvate dehydrogenase E2 component (dihydrolipoamide acetyltransferase)
VSRSFDLYYKKAVRHDWNNHHRRQLHEAPVPPAPMGDPMAAAAPAPAPAGPPDSESLIQRYNEIWAPAVEFVQEKLNDLPVEAEGTNDKLFLDAILGVLNQNRLSAEEAGATDPASLRQKVEGLVAKLESMRQDSTNTELASYLDTFTSGMNSFKNSVDVGSDEPAPAPNSADAQAAPADPAAAPAAPGEVPPADGAAPAPAGPEGAPAGPEPVVDQNSPDTLLADLNLDIK